MKLFQGKRLAILTGGGDTPALNSSIEAIQQQAEELGFEVLGIRRGWKGLLGDGDLVKLTGHQVDPWYGGTVLRSSRTNPFNGNEALQQELYRNLESYHIDVLVAIGGDDTIGAAKRLFEQKQFPVIGFPKTIDNDLRTFTLLHTTDGNAREVVLCPGFATAIDAVVDYFNRLKTYAMSHERVLVTEVMGRDAGWLAASASLAEADLILVPEVTFDADAYQRFMNTVALKYQKAAHGFITIAVAEGVKWFDYKTGSEITAQSGYERDEFGHANFGGISELIAKDIKHQLNLPAKSVISGFFARSGACGNFDRKLTQVLAQRLQKIIKEERFGTMPVVSNFGKHYSLDVANTKAVELSDIENFPMPVPFYDKQVFNVSAEFKFFIQQLSQRSPQRIFDLPFKSVLK